MPPRQENELIDMQDEEAMASMVVYPKKVVKKRSLISILVKGKRKEQDTDEPADIKALTEKEEELFRKHISRDLDTHKYSVRKKIAAGGMGSIHYVYDTDLQRHTILKVILPQHKGNAMLIKSFIKEARFTGQLEHPNIIPVHDLGYLPGYGIYFTMKQVLGESLLDIIRKVERKTDGFHNKYDYYMMLNIIRKVCDAISFAHSKHIVHRDIKPGNIMVGNYGEVLLMDWGLAKTVRSNSSRSASGRETLKDTFPDAGNTKVTRFGVVKGTPAYMPPEQAVGDASNIDHQSDIFLVGATLYHMFTYLPPYFGYGIKEIIRRARAGDFVPPQELRFKNDSLSMELCSIISRAMAANKKDRYQTVQEMADDIDDLMHGKMESIEHIFEKGDYLMREGEIGTNSYIIKGGTVEVYKQSRGRSKLSLGTVSAGAIVGEMALITDEPRSANAVAIEKTTAYELNKDLFKQNLKKLPPFMEKTITALAERLQESNTKLTKK